MTQKILIKEDSKPYLIECPEEPKYHEMQYDFKKRAAYSNYQEALEQAKQSAVPFDKPEEVIKIYSDSWPRFSKHLQNGDTFPIPTGYRVEVKECPTPCGEICIDMGKCGQPTVTLLPISKEETTPKAKEIIGGYQPTNTVDTSNPPRQKAVNAKEESQPIKEEKIKDMDFLVWYSGMKPHQIVKAYKRYLKEKVKFINP